MLKLKPNCEHCDIDLPANSTVAMICTFECTFCAHCVETVLHNVCPNCGGGFERRPQRIVTAWNKGVSLSDAPASTERVFEPVDVDAHERFASNIRDIPPHQR